MKVSFVTMTKNKMFPLLDFGEESRQFLQRTDCQNKRKISDTNQNVQKRNKNGEVNIITIYDEAGNLSK